MAKRGDLFIGVGVLAMLCGGSVSRQGPEQLITGATISAIGWAFLIWGAMNYVAWKGYTRWLGLFAYLLLPGLIVLTFFPNRRAPGNGSQSQNVAEVGAVRYRYLFALVPLGLLYASFIGLLIMLHSGVSGSDWQTLAQGDLGFKAQMPGVVREEHSTQQSAAGPIVTDKFSVMPRGKKELFMIVTVQFPEQVTSNIGSTERLLELGKQDVLTALNGALKSEQQISLNGIPGLDVEVLPARGAIVKARVYVTNNQLYQVSVHVPQIRLKSADVRRFFDSFEIKFRPAG